MREINKKKNKKVLIKFFSIQKPRLLNSTRDVQSQQKKKESFMNHCSILNLKIQYVLENQFGMEFILKIDFKLN